jgi:hypothetical protein
LTSKQKCRFSKNVFCESMRLVGKNIAPFMN